MRQTPKKEKISSRDVPLYNCADRTVGSSVSFSPPIACSEDLFTGFVLVLLMPPSHTNPFFVVVLLELCFVTWVLVYLVRMVQLKTTVLTSRVCSSRPGWTYLYVWFRIASQVTYRLEIRSRHLLPPPPMRTLFYVNLKCSHFFVCFTWFVWRPETI